MQPPRLIRDTGISDFVPFHNSNFYLNLLGTTFLIILLVCFLVNLNSIQLFRNIFRFWVHTNKLFSIISVRVIALKTPTHDSKLFSVLDVFYCCFFFNIYLLSILFQPNFDLQNWRIFPIFPMNCATWHIIGLKFLAFKFFFRKLNKYFTAQPKNSKRNPVCKAKLFPMRLFKNVVTK